MNNNNNNFIKSNNSYQNLINNNNNNNSILNFSLSLPKLNSYRIENNNNNNNYFNNRNKNKKISRNFLKILNNLNNNSSNQKKSIFNVYENYNLNILNLKKKLNKIKKEIEILKIQNNKLLLIKEENLKILNEIILANKKSNDPIDINFLLNQNIIDFDDENFDNKNIFSNSDEDIKKEIDNELYTTEDLKVPQLFA